MKTKQDLKVGDKAKILRHPIKAFVGKFGTVKLVDYSAMCPIVLDLGQVYGYYRFYASEIEKVEAKAMDAQEMIRKFRQEQDQKSRQERKEAVLDTADELELWAEVAARHLRDLESENTRLRRALDKITTAASAWVRATQVAESWETWIRMLEELQEAASQARELLLENDLEAEK